MKLTNDDEEQSGNVSIVKKFAALRQRHAGSRAVEGTMELVVVEATGFKFY